MLSPYNIVQGQYLVPTTVWYQYNKYFFKHIFGQAGTWFHLWSLYRYIIEVNWNIYGLSQQCLIIEPYRKPNKKATLPKWTCRYIQAEIYNVETGIKNL